MENDKVQTLTSNNFFILKKVIRISQDVLVFFRWTRKDRDENLVSPGPFPGSSFYLGSLF
jgi:hypothetical protein